MVNSADLQRTVVLFLTLIVLALNSPSLAEAGLAHSQDASDEIELLNPRHISWNSDGTLIAVGTEAGIWLYNTDDWRSPPMQIFADAVIHSLVFMPNNPDLIVVSLEARDTAGCGTGSDALSGVFVYDLSLDEVLVMIRDFSGACGADRVSQLQLNAEGTLLITHTSGQLVTYTLPDGEFDRHITPYNFGNFPQFDQIAFSDDGTQLAVTQINGDTSYLFGVGYSSGEFVGIEAGQITGIITALALSSEGDRLIIGDATGTLHAYTRAEDTDAYRDAQVFTRDERSAMSGRINAVAIAPNGVIVTAESDPHAVIRFFDAETWAEVAHYGGDEATLGAFDLDFNPDGQLLAVLIDESVHIIDMTHYNQLAEWTMQAD